jgi:ribokinase
VDVVVVGSFNQDHVWNVDRFPHEGETRPGRFASGPGGKGFNQAVACRRLGVKTVFVGALGDDALGAHARELAQVEGIAAEFETTGEPTGSACVLVDFQGQNQIVVGLGANLAISEAFIERQRARILSAKVLLLQLEIALPAVRAALALAREAPALAILNPAPLVDGLGPELLRDVDVLTPNEHEFRQLLKQAYGWPVREDFDHLGDEELHALCRKTGIATVVLTLGARGAFVSHVEGHRRGDDELCYRVAGHPVHALDTTGAGDAFNGALAAGLVRYALGRPFRAAVEYANRVAAVAVQHAGAAAAMPTADQVKAHFAARP